ncbi:MAG TPA: DUF2938 domain-containing protein [Anaerolineales bacterium]|nr:DUF2938 domain-containing protein [Anaerolineales bacterium]
MNFSVLFLLRALLMGIGATLTFDLWGLFVKYAFKIPPSNLCLVGRWVRYMPEGIFTHANLAVSPKKRGECAVGWLAHYSIGVTFALTFAAWVSDEWFQSPTPLPAILFGVVTVLAPFFIMQPAFGLGIAASKTSNPTQARLRSLMNHTAFGFGLYLFGWVVNGLLV